MTHGVRDGRSFSPVAPLLLTAFVDVVGLFMVLPLLPHYARGLGADAMLITVLLTAFTAAQLVSAPVWGWVSDHYGRRPALLVGLGAAAVAYVVFAYATSIWLLLVSRVIQGAGGGTTGVLQAYVADTVTPSARTQTLGWLSSATNVGVALGPPLGALALQHMGLPGPGLCAATLCLVNMVFTWRYLPESHAGRLNTTGTSQPDAPRLRHWSPDATRAAIRQVLRQGIRHPTAVVPRLLWMYAITMGAFQALLALLALFLTDKFSVRADQIWIVFTYLGLLAVLIRVRLLGWAVARYGEIWLCRVGLGLLAVGLGVLPWMPTVATFAGAIALIPFGTALTFPCLTTLLAQASPARLRGVYFGAQQMGGGIGSIVIPLWAGFAYEHLGHGIPFWTSASLVAGVLWLSGRLSSSAFVAHPTLAGADATIQ